MPRRDSYAFMAFILGCIKYWNIYDETERSRTVNEGKCERRRGITNARGLLNCRKGELFVRQVLIGFMARECKAFVISKLCFSHSLSLSFLLSTIALFVFENFATTNQNDKYTTDTFFDWFESFRVSENWKIARILTKRLLSFSSALILLPRVFFSLIPDLAGSDFFEYIARYYLLPSHVARIYTENTLWMKPQRCL